jgi:glycosyltransferase involved in cell wall biosynthesis
MIEYFTRSWPMDAASLTVVDSYGPGSKAAMPFYFGAAMVRLTAAALAGQIGLLHVHMAERLSVWRKGLVVYLGSTWSIPVVLHLHGADFADYCRGLPRWRQRALQRMMSRAEVVVVLGEYWRSFVVEELGVDASRVAVLHNAVPGPEVAPRRDPGGCCRILLLGVVSERKGVPTLLEALTRAPLAALDWRVTIAGNGEVEKYRAEAARLGLADRVTFVGWVDESGARRLLAEADVFVLPSRNEGLPVAILEAMAYGLPVVATAVGSIADAVVQGKTGILVQPGDAGALAEALQALIERPAWRQDLGAKARGRYEQHFEISAFNERLAEIFHHAHQRRMATG